MIIYWKHINLNQFFFFSSRRRHTRYWRDWSSDVCSSDLKGTLRRSSSEQSLLDREYKPRKVHDEVGNLSCVCILYSVIDVFCFFIRLFTAMSAGTLALRQPRTIENSNPSTGKISYKVRNHKSTTDYSQFKKKRLLKHKASAFFSFRII